MLLYYYTLLNRCTSDAIWHVRWILHTDESNWWVINILMKYDQKKSKMILAALFLKFNFIHVSCLLYKQNIIDIQSILVYGHVRIQHINNKNILVIAIKFELYII